jgi:hypothetical protein
MPVRTSDLQICKETATGVDSTGQFQLKDLVNISYVFIEMKNEIFILYLF